MQVEIMAGYLNNLALLTHSYSFFWTPEGVPTPCFYLHKYQIISMLSDKVDLPIRATKVAFQDTVSAAY